MRGREQQQHRYAPRGPGTATTPTALPGHRPSHGQPCPCCHGDATSKGCWASQLPTAGHTGPGNDPKTAGIPWHPWSSVPCYRSHPERDHRAGSQAQGYNHPVRSTRCGQGSRTLPTCPHPRAASTRAPMPPELQKR